MAGTREGGLKARDRNLAKDPNFYSKIGTKGGRNGHTGGFAATVNQECDCSLFPYGHNKNQCAGKKGGLISRRGPKVIE